MLQRSNHYNRWATGTWCLLVLIAVAVCAGCAIAAGTDEAVRDILCFASVGNAPDTRKDARLHGA